MELTLKEALQKAVEAHKAGQIQEADRLYTAILQAQPKHPDANHNMGLLAVGVGKIQEALPFFKIALEANPSIGQYWLSYINGLIKLDRITDAQTVLDQAKSKGASGEPFDQLEQRLNVPNEVSIDPQQDQLNTLINLYQQGQLQQTLDSAKQLLSQFPNSLTLYNIQGAANAGLGQFDAALNSYKHALKIKPDYADAYYNMGVVLKDKGDPEAAIDSYKQALKIKPDYADAYYNMGVALMDKGDPEAAIDSYKQAININSDYAESYCNMGGALQDKGDPESAIESYRQAIKIKPDYAEAHYNTSLLNLSLQDFEAGWSLYEWRWKLPKVLSSPLKSSKPLWRPSQKQRVLLWCEQGVGDQIIFASLIPDLYSSSSKLIVLIDKRLIPLFRRSFPDDIDFRPKNEVVSETEYDSQIPMGSVPLYFRKSIDSFKSSAQGWLSANSVKTKTLRSQLLTDDSETLIGISWHSTSSKKSKASNKVIPLNKIAPFLHSSDVKLVSLQYGDVDDEIKKLMIDFGIKVIQVPGIDNMNDIDGLAALISACDEVVSIDNVTAHLAGSLGKQSKILITSSCNWWWGQGQQNSYWYNSVHLYRQTKIGDWEHVIKQL